MLFGNGGGSFRAVEIPNVAAYVIGMAATDFNRDGCLASVATQNRP
jgi:hypothetical protein